MLNLKSNQMTKFLEITAAAEQQDLDLVQMSLLNMLDAFPTYLAISRHAQKVSITDFAILYYDLHSFLDKELKRDGRYQLNKVKRFALQFKSMLDVIVSVSEEKEEFAVRQFEDLYLTFTNWFDAVATPLNYTVD